MSCHSKKYITSLKEDDFCDICERCSKCGIIIQANHTCNTWNGNNNSYNLKSRKKDKIRNNYSKRVSMYNQNTTIYQSIKFQKNFCQKKSVGTQTETILTASNTTQTNDDFNNYINLNDKEIYRKLIKNLVEKMAQNKILLTKLHMLCANLQIK